ncbi:MAG TPA: hypothetical protein VF017_19385 [Thermoanaerobaculia bacterium]|nr:hypothetical protein [Thermoanaerobaculia bacterium]
MFDLVLDREIVGKLAILPYYCPSFAFHSTYVLVWAGTSLAVVDIERRRSVQPTWNEDEIRAVFPFGSGWCIVGETGIWLTDHSFTATKQEIFLGEVVLEAWWMQGRLHIRDFRERILAFETQGGAEGLAPTSETARLLIEES